MPASSYNRLGIALFAIVAWSNLVTVTWGQFVDLPSPPQVVSVDVVDEDDEITAAAFVDKLKNREPRPRVDMMAISSYSGLGHNVTPMIVSNRPNSPMAAVMGVMYFNASCSVMPLIRAMTRNPLSFIQEIGFDPQPMASAR